MNTLEIKSDGTNNGTIIIIDGVVQRGIQKFKFEVHELMPWANIELKQVMIPEGGAFEYDADSTNSPNMMARPQSLTNDPNAPRIITTG